MIDRRRFIKVVSVAAAASWLPIGQSFAKSYLTLEQAMEKLLPGRVLAAKTVILTPEQIAAIEKATDVRVRNVELKTWQAKTGEWFILDQVIGKHENIDWALALDAQGRVLGLDILTYRESYGHQIRNEKWRSQFHQLDNSTHFTVDDNIKNIAGATLSCVHITEGVNRLTQTWQLALRSV